MNGTVAGTPIAVVGIGCRLPGGVDSPTSFWELLSAGRDVLADIPKDRWKRERFYAPDPSPGKSRVNRGGFLSQSVDKFDPGFFNISPLESDFIDPQQRLLLEVALETIEDGGVRLEQIAATRTGVYVGGFTLDYSQLQFTNAEGEPPTVAMHTATGTVMTMLSNRISHAFDFLGPSMTVDTACSSSLVAIHLACQSIWNGESEQALAGGVNLMLSPNFTIAASTGGFLSPTSTSRAFDSRANGYVRGEGVGLVYLKPLERALHDGDRIYGVIRGTGVSQDGRTNGITVPNGDSQRLAIKAALAQSGIAAKSVSYVEAHGTGTPVGDPVEARALGEVYGISRPRNESVMIGSVKTNMGHLEAAAGVAGFIKAVLALYYGQIPPHLHLDEVNPAIDLEALQLAIPTTSQSLPSNDLIRVAVNSFGFGGTNAHAVLESAPPTVGVSADSEQDKTGGIAGVARITPISAQSEAALRGLASRYAETLDADLSLDELNSALVHRRTHHRPQRAVIIGEDRASVADSLRRFADKSVDTNAVVGDALDELGPISFVYTGMGPQWWGMARGLIGSNPVFTAAIDKCDQALSRLAPWSIKAEILADEDTSRMNEAQIAQPANFAIQYALTALWRSVGVKPELIVGHSAGEVAAAWAAGALGFTDAVTVIYHRARIQHKVSGQGRLLAVGMTTAQAHELNEVSAGDVEVAALNGPTSIALVGPHATLDEIASRLEDQGVFARLVPGDVPYHSSAMDPLREELTECLAGLQPTLPTMPWFSTVTGQRVPGDGSVLADAEYWWRNVRDQVRFDEASTRMLKAGARTFIELGPSIVLANPLRESAANEGFNCRVVGSLDRKREDAYSFARAVGQLWVWGVPLDLDALEPSRPMRTIPSYVWDHSTFWNESRSSQLNRLAQYSEPYLGNRADTPTTTWRRLWDGAAPAALSDHVVHGAAVFPGAGYAEIAAEVARSQYGAQRCTISRLTFDSPFTIRDAETRVVDTVLAEDRASIEITGRTLGTDVWTRHASATLLPPPASQPTVDLEGIRSRLTESWSADVIYEQFAAAGFSYGPAFRRLKEVRSGHEEWFALLDPVTSDSYPGSPDPVLSPIVLDAAFQLLLPLALEQADGRNFIPMGVDAIVIHETPRGEMYAHASAAAASIDHNDVWTVAGDVLIMDSTGRILVEVQGFTVRAITESTRAQRLGSEWVHELDWEPQVLETDRSISAMGRWLVITDGKGIAGSVIARLGDLGGEVIQLGLDDDAGVQLDSVLTDEPWRGVLHLGSQSAPVDDDFEWSVTTGPLSLIRLATELDSRGLAVPLTVVTVGAQVVDGSIHASGLRQSTMLGIGRVLHHELFGLESRLIDLDPDDPNGHVDDLIDDLLNSDPVEDQVAFRKHERMVLRLNPSQRRGGRLPRPIRADGTYLVTGGLGALGVLVTRWLAEAGAGVIVLTSRSGLPARSEWDQLLDRGKYTEAIRAIRRAEELGSDVLVEGIDITEADEMRLLLDRLSNEGLPPLRGVFHAAGQVSDQLIVRMTKEQLTSVLTPKVKGSWALHEATRSHDLDFFLLFSSVSAIVPSPGQGNYAAGNAFLDALAHYRRTIGLPALSVNWGPWDTGMIAELGLGSLYAQRGIDLIDIETGMRLLGELLGSDDTQQGVVSAHWPTVVESFAITPALINHLAQAEDCGEDSVPISERLEGASTPEELREVVVTGVTELIGRVLRTEIDETRLEEPLTRNGLDSMIASELRIRLEQSFQTAPTIIFLLSDATVISIAEEILRELEGSTDDAEVEDIMAEMSDLDDAEKQRLLVELGLIPEDAHE